jgi:hypothetical protein
MGRSAGARAGRSAARAALMWRPAPASGARAGGAPGALGRDGSGGGCPPRVPPINARLTHPAAPGGRPRPLMAAPTTDGGRRSRRAGRAQAARARCPSPGRALSAAAHCARRRAPPTGLARPCAPAARRPRPAPAACTPSRPARPRRARPPRIPSQGAAARRRKPPRTLPTPLRGAWARERAGDPKSAEPREIFAPRAAPPRAMAPPSKHPRPPKPNPNHLPRPRARFSARHAQAPTARAPPMPPARLRGV